MPKRAKSMGNTGRLILAQKINTEYMSDDFFGLVVQGRQRIGKSSYAQRCLAESYGVWEKLYVQSLKREQLALRYSKLYFSFDVDMDILRARLCVLDTFPIG